MLHLLGHPDSDAAQALAHGLEERVAEGVHADREDAADAVDLDQVALDTRHHGPDVQEGQDGKENSPDQRQGNAHQCRQQAVAPVLGDSEGCEAGFPHTVEAVGPCGFCNHIFKFNLRKMKVDELEIAGKNFVWEYKAFGELSLCEKWNFKTQKNISAPHSAETQHSDLLNTFIPCQQSFTRVLIWRKWNHYGNFNAVKSKLIISTQINFTPC